jgi:predicted glycoside hydrolase/deacetylase ChbG (UPF0249 family)
MSPGVNRGVARALDGGLVREVSVCATGEAVEEGVEIALARDAGVGLHFSLTAGRAITGRITGLTDASGRFLPLGAVLASCVAGRPDREAIADELRAQLARLEDLGAGVAHLDGHHHVHVFPVVSDAVLEVARERRIDQVRVPSESARTAPRLSARRLLLRALSRGFVARAHALGARVSALPFVGLGLYDRPDFGRRLDAVLRRPPAEAFELMVHPRVADEGFARVDRRARAGEWRAELEALSAPARVAEVERLAEPVRFRDVA